MDVTELSLPGLKLIRPKVFRDQRGYLFENYHQNRYRDAGIECRFVQDNHSRSIKGTLRGLHYQSSPGQDKLVRVGRGRIFDVAVDVRLDSATFGRWEGVILDEERHLQLFVPAGFAHGFCVVSDEADVLYKTSSFYDPDREYTLRWNDPDIGIEWPIADPLLSERDRLAESLAEYRRRVTS